MCVCLCVSGEEGAIWLLIIWQNVQLVEEEEEGSDCVCVCVCVYAWVKKTIIDYLGIHRVKYEIQLFFLVYTTRTT